MKKMMRKFKNERGLTLVELLAVVVILAIIAVIAFVLIGNVIENSKKDAHVANAQQLIASAKLYEANGYDLVNEGPVESETLYEQGLLDKLINPWTKETEDDYKGTVSKDTNGVYTVTLKGGEDCDINHKETDVSKGREKVCKK